MNDFEFLDIIKDYCSINPIDYQYYHQLFDKRTIILNSDICEDIVEKIFLPLKDFEEDSNTEPVTLILNSSGGSVSDGFFLAYVLKNYKKPLTILVTGYAASMAAIILAGTAKNPNITRKCYPCSYALIHDGYVALAPSETKTAGDIMSFNDKVDNDIKKFFVENTNITNELYDSKARHQWFLSAEEMKEYGFIDKIIGMDCDN